jgi:hypothetical protein
LQHGYAERQEVAMGLKILAAAIAAFAAYSFGQRIAEENRKGGGHKVLCAPPPDVGVDVSVRE